MLLGTIVVADPGDKQCNTGENYPDPGYPSQALPALSSPNPSPTCTVANGTLQFSPGYYTKAGMFNAHLPAVRKRCRRGPLLHARVYYFDFGYDPPTRVDDGHEHRRW
jgi:hypothetical protein